MANEIQELNPDQLDAVTGGMKWTRGTQNEHVIDARGGQVEGWWYTTTYDVHGKVSSVT
jgi:hypothetical protein